MPINHLYIVLKSLLIIADHAKNPEPSTVKSLENICVAHDCNFPVKYADYIHDRFWIVDQSRALGVGGSFNGVGAGS